MQEVKGEIEEWYIGHRLTQITLIFKYMKDHIYNVEKKILEEVRG